MTLLSRTTQRRSGGKKTLRKKRGALLIALLLLISGLALGGFWYAGLDKPVHLDESVSITIASGSTSAHISQLLHENGLTRHGLAFRLYARQEGIENQLKPGTYTFSETVSLEEIARQLLAGKNAEALKVTIPEGLTVAQTAEIFAAQGLADIDIFMEYAQNAPFEYDYLPPPNTENRLEGFLFPNTYMINVNWSEEEIIQMLLAQFDKVWKEEWRQRAADLDLTAFEVITLASIIEKEARIAQDRPLIASVFHNRLQIQMALQSCATVQFVLGEPKYPLLYEDLEIESPYNTYKHRGLPPGPIAAPGQAAIEAALYPAETDFLYFRAKSDGSHYFSKTLAEHNEAGRLME